MKRVFAILLIGVVNSSPGQSWPTGTYCTKHEDDFGRCITFLNDTLFEYNSWSLLSNTRGSGTYQFYHGSLLLSFYSDSIRHTHACVMKDTSCTIRDTIRMYFSVTDRDTHEPISHAYIQLFGLPGITGLAMTDINGNAKFVFEKNEKEMKVTVNFVGYEKFSQTVRTDTCQIVQVGLAPYTDRNIETGERRYRVKRKSRKIIKLMEGDFLYCLYRKKTEW